MSSDTIESRMSKWIEIPGASTILNEETGRWEIQIPEPDIHIGKRNHVVYCPVEECKFWGRYEGTYRGHYALAHILGLPDLPESRTE